MSDENFYTLAGTVTDLTERQAKTRYGLKPVYGGEVSGQAIEFGFKKDEKVPYPSRGDVVSYRVKYEYGKYKVCGLSVGDPPAPVKAAAPGGGAASATGTTKPAGGSFRPFPVPMTHGDTSIIRQNSLGHAVALVAAFVSTIDGDSEKEGPDLVELGADVALRIAYKFAAFSSGNLDAEVLAEITKKAE